MKKHLLNVVVVLNVLSGNQAFGVDIKNETGMTIEIVSNYGNRSSRDYAQPGGALHVFDRLPKYNRDLVDIKIYLRSLGNLIAYPLKDKNGKVIKSLVVKIVNGKPIIVENQ